MEKSSKLSIKPKGNLDIFKYLQKENLVLSNEEQDNIKKYGFIVKNIISLSEYFTQVYIHISVGVFITPLLLLFTIGQYSYKVFVYIGMVIFILWYMFLLIRKSIYYLNMRNVFITGYDNGIITKGVIYDKTFSEEVTISTLFNQIFKIPLFSRDTINFDGIKQISWYIRKLSIKSRERKFGEVFGLFTLGCFIVLISNPIGILLMLVFSGSKDLQNSIGGYGFLIPFIVLIVGIIFSFIIGGIALILLWILGKTPFYEPSSYFANIGIQLQKLTPQIEEQSQKIQSEFEKDMNFSVLHSGFEKLSLTFSEIVSLVLKLETIEKKANKGNLFDSDKYINSLRSDIVEPLKSLREFLKNQRISLLNSQKELSRVRVGANSEESGNIELSSKRSESLIEELDMNIGLLEEMIGKMG